MRGPLLFLFGAALPLSFYFAFVNPDRIQAIRTAEERVEARTKEAQALQTIAGRLAEFQREQKTLQERLAVLEAIRPASRDTAPLFDELRGLAAAEGLARVSVAEIAGGTDRATLPIRLSAEGSQPALAALLGRLTRTARLLRLGRIELERLDRGRYALVLRVVAFCDKTAS